MEIKDILTISFSVAAIVVSLFALRQATNSANEAKKQRLTNQGLQEMEIWKNMKELNKELSECWIRIIKTEDFAEADALLSLYDELFESLRNFYEILCSNYLNEKLDNGSFLNLYEKSLLSFVESDANAEFYKENSVYENTLKVYEKFKTPSPK